MTGAGVGMPAPQPPHPHPHISVYTVFWQWPNARQEDAQGRKGSFDFRSEGPGKDGSGKRLSCGCRLGGSWPQCIHSLEAERDGCCSVHPVSLTWVWGPGPWDKAAPIQVVLPSSVQDLETPSQTWPGSCPLGDSKSSQVDCEVEPSPLLCCLILLNYIASPEKEPWHKASGKSRNQVYIS